MHNITFVTGNKSKAEELVRYLEISIPHHDLDLTEIQSLDLAEIVEHKAKEAYRILGTPVLVEDVGLTFHDLGKLPGPLIKWFLKELNNQGLCELLNTQNRSATAHVLYGLFDGTNFQTFSGEVKGTISPEPRGLTTFGWNPIFIPEGHTKTWAEMDLDEKNETSMRRIALLKLAEHLKNCQNV